MNGVVLVAVVGGLRCFRCGRQDGPSYVTLQLVSLFCDKLNTFKQASLFIYLYETSTLI